MNIWKYSKSKWLRDETSSSCGLIHSCAILRVRKAVGLQYVFFHTCFLLSVRHRKSYEDSIVFYSVSRHDVEVYNRTALRFKRLYNVMCRVVYSHPGRTRLKIRLGHFYMMGPFLLVRYRSTGSTSSINCFGVMAE